MSSKELVNIPPTKILQDGNYYIGYNYDTKSNIGQITISWLAETYEVAYRDGEFLNNYTGVSIKAPEYSVIPLIWTLIQMVVEDYNFPSEWVITQIDQLNTHNLYFGDKDVDPRSNDLLDLCKEVMSFGLRPDDLQMSKVFKIKDGFLSIIELLYGFRPSET